MSIKEIRTFLDIQDAIIRRAKIADTEDNRADIKEKINSFYQKISFKQHYRWSGETKPLVLQAKYSTGTITATNGSDQVTGSSTVWAEFDHLFCKMKIGSVSSPFKIIRIGSTTTATLDAPYTGDTESGLAYEIYSDEIGLFPDLMNIRKIYVPGRGDPIYPCGPEEIDRLRYESPFRSGVLERYTIHGLNIYTQKVWSTFNINTDFWEDDYDDIPRNRNLVIWPAVLSADKIIQIRYTKIVPSLGADTDEPLIPYENRSILVYGPLSEWFLQGRDLSIKREWERLYKEDLISMEADIETTDDELIMTVDRRGHRSRSSFLWAEEDLTVE